MNDSEREERTFILRLWRERPPTEEEPAVWRFALTDAHSGERRAFRDLEGVVAFLRSRAGLPAAGGAPVAVESEEAQVKE